MTSAMEDAHILMSMTYASRANPDVSANDFNEILQQAQVNLSHLYKEYHLSKKS